MIQQVLRGAAGAGRIATSTKTTSSNLSNLQSSSFTTTTTTTTTTRRLRLQLKNQRLVHTHLERRTIPSSSSCATTAAAVVHVNDPTTCVLLETLVDATLTANHHAHVTNGDNVTSCTTLFEEQSLSSSSSSLMLQESNRRRTLNDISSITFLSTQETNGDGDGQEGEDDVIDDVIDDDAEGGGEGGKDTSNDNDIPNDNEEITASEETAASEEMEPSFQSLSDQLRPLQVVSELDKHIVGQSDAKRAVAIAMRNRWRRRQLPKDLMKEVTPRNVLMIGPTGCGKTEVARRMAALSDAPFIKVEATKFTEVGYHGRDVDQIIRDLMDAAMNLTRKKKTDEFRSVAQLKVQERLLDLLTGPKSASRESFRHLLQKGALDDQEVDVDVPVDKNGGAGAGGAGGFVVGGDANNPNMAAMTDFLNKMANPGGKRGPPTERKKLPISEAREVILEMELDQMLENVDLKKDAISAVQESGVVFIDEIDKICSSRDYTSKSADASAEGVQRDLLPLVEGTTINTKYGNVNTDYILFIASGAFHSVKPSDMLPELQGRLPIRVELNGLDEDDLYKILTEPVANLLRQQIELIGTEGVKLVFEDDAVREIARMAALLNKTVENIGARRLHTVIERIMELLSFEAAEMETDSVITVDKALVEERLGDVMGSSDLSRYIL